MSIYGSHPEINALRITQLRSKCPRGCEKIVVVNETTVVRLKGNKWWTDHKRFDKCAITPLHVSHRVDNLLTGLMLLGFISKEALAHHIAIARKADEESSLREDNRLLLEIAARRKLKLPTLIK